MLDALSIVIPAYNEAASLRETIADAFAVGARVARDLEVIVCNDGSTDATGEIARDAARGEPRLRIFDQPRNRGIEASIRALYERAQHAWVFLNAADRQWPMSALEVMAAETQHADFVIGVRPNKRSVYTPYRRVLSWSFERVVRALGAPAGDPGSIKLARRELLDVALTSRGVFAEGERIIRAARSGARIVEVAVPFQRRGAGKASGARRDVVVRAALDAARLTTSLAIGWPRPTRG
jgi:glycosyltransferase involved in cell wall biosynthesis